MNCQYHSSHEAHAICEKCKQPICPECTVNIDDKTICRQCIQQNLTPSLRPIPRETFLGKLLFFCCSLIPGAAHMQLGLFRRGLQLMILTFGGVSLIDFLDLDFIIPLLLIPTWFFSFFESYHLKSQMEQGLNLKDQDLFDRQIFDYTPLLKNRRLVGGLITFIGILSLIHELDRSEILFDFFPLFRHWDYFSLVKNSLFPLCLILAGIYLIVKAKKEAPADET